MFRGGSRVVPNEIAVCCRVRRAHVPRVGCSQTGPLMTDITTKIYDKYFLKSHPTVNVRLAAVRKMVMERNGLLSSEETSNLIDVPDVRQRGTRLGNWLTKEQARELLQVSDRSILKIEGIELDRRFTDDTSGKDIKRPQLTALLSFVREGDTVVCHSMDRLGRNLDDLRKLVFSLQSGESRFSSVKRT